MHDAQVAVDEDINGRLGRFSSGTDKLTARTFMLAGRDYSHRSLVVHLAQGVGTILSSTSLLYGAALKDAANAYNSGFLTALTGVWTDHSTDQLNLLNDEGFSSYRTERTVVPKLGTAEFIIFMRSDIYQQGWWVQDCANTIPIRNPEHKQKTSVKESIYCIGQLKTANPDSRCLIDVPPGPGLGIDLDLARRLCTHYYKARPRGSQIGDCDFGDQSNCGSGFEDVGDTEPMKGDFGYFKPKSVAYKSWSPRARMLFRELALAVVAGSHISEETQGKPSIANVDCPKSLNGFVDFDKAENGTLSCTLTGTNLEKVQALKLVNSNLSTDSKAASSTKLNSLSKPPTVEFSVETLGALPAKLYKSYSILSDGSELQSEAPAIQFSGEPYLSSASRPDPPSIDFESLLKEGAKPVELILKGFHLDELQAIELSRSPDDKSNAPVTPFDIAVDPGATSSQAHFTLKSANAKDAKTFGDFRTNHLELSIALKSKGSPNTLIPTKQLLYVTGNVANAALKAKKSIPVAAAAPKAPTNSKTADEKKRVGPH